MDEALRKRWLMAEQDQRISEAIEREQGWLRNFIQRRVADQGDAEDILQDVFYELVEAYRMMKPAEQVTALLFRVTRIRIIACYRGYFGSGNFNIAETDDTGAALERAPLTSSKPPQSTFGNVNMYQSH